MSSAHTIGGITDLFNDFSWGKLAKTTFDVTIFGALACTVGHAFMQPMGLYDVSHTLGDSLTQARDWLAEKFTGSSIELPHPGGEILSNIDPEGFDACFEAGGSVHPHGTNASACIP